MSKVAGIGEPASELEHLIVDLSESGLLVFVFGVGWWTAHLTGVTAPVFRGPADRRWWHVELGGDGTSWTMDVRVEEITGVCFVREPYPFPSFPGREVLTVQFLGPDKDTVLYCYLHDLMTVSGCARRSWRPGEHCASATAIAMSRGSIEAPCWPRQPDLRGECARSRTLEGRKPVALCTDLCTRCRGTDRDGGVGPASRA